LAVLHAMATATTLIYHLRESLLQSALLPLKSRVGATRLKKSHYDYIARVRMIYFISVWKRMARIYNGGSAWTTVLIALLPRSRSFTAAG